MTSRLQRNGIFKRPKPGAWAFFPELSYTHHSPSQITKNFEVEELLPPPLALSFADARDAETLPRTELIANNLATHIKNEAYKFVRKINLCATVKVRAKNRRTTIIMRNNEKERAFVLNADAAMC